MSWLLCYWKQAVILLANCGTAILAILPGAAETDLQRCHPTWAKSLIKNAWMGTWVGVGTKQPKQCWTKQPGLEALWLLTGWNYSICEQVSGQRYAEIHQQWQTAEAKIALILALAALVELSQGKESMVRVCWVSYVHCHCSNLIISLSLLLWPGLRHLNQLCAFHFVSRVSLRRAVLHIVVGRREELVVVFMYKIWSILRVTKPGIKDLQ